MTAKVSTLYCKRSGIAIAQVRTLCVEGFPLVTRMADVLVHPIYAQNLDSLLAKLQRDLNAAHECEWKLSPAQEQRIALEISAILYNLGALVDDYACLPDLAVCVGSGRRLLALANWYHFATSKRITLPRYRPHPDNFNQSWGNLSGWIEACEDLRTEWQTRKEKLKKAEEFTAQTEKTAKAVHLKRNDLTSVWNWMALQLSNKYSSGRLSTFENLWRNGDINQEEWCLDDVEDLQFAVVECCDLGNDITHYITHRLKHIREMIRDFYSSFTIISRPASGTSAHPDLTEAERKKEQEFFSDIDARASKLTELPPEPQRSDFASMALFLRAQAQHRLLVKRFSLQAAQAQTKD